MWAIAHQVWGLSFVFCSFLWSFWASMGGDAASRPAGGRPPKGRRRGPPSRAARRGRPPRRRSRPTPGASRAGGRRPSPGPALAAPPLRWAVAGRGWRLRCWLLFCLCSPVNGVPKARQGLRFKWRVCAIHPFLIRSAAARGSGILVGFGSHRMAVFRPSFSDSLANQYPPNFITGFVFSGYYYAFCWCWVECVPPGFVRPED